MIKGAPEDPFISGGGSFADRYQLLELLGQGRIGRVYKALDNLGEGDSPCYRAIKIPHSPQASKPQFAARFHREYLTGLRNIHPSIVRCLDVGEFQGRPFMVCEYVDGIPIDRWFQSRQRDFEALAEVLETTLEAISAAHAAGLIHKELKPSNWLVGQQQQNNRRVPFPRLLDFGLAGRLDDQLTVGSHQAILQSLLFLSPEQALGERGDVRSDLYSLGAVLYYVASARAPFVSDSSAGALLSCLQDTVVPISRVRSDIPVWLERLVHRLLQKDPAKRPTDANEVLTMVRRRIQHQTGTATGGSSNESLACASEREVIQGILRAAPVKGASLWVSASSSRCLAPVSEELRAASQSGSVRLARIGAIPGLLYDARLTALHLLRSPELNQLSASGETTLQKVESFLESSGRPRPPLVLWLENLDVLDDEAYKTIQNWIQWSRQYRLVLVVTTLDRPKSKDVGNSKRPEALANLRLQFSHQIQMSGQSQEECAAMIEDRLWAPPPPDLVSWLWRTSSGVPEFVRALLQRLEGTCIQVDFGTIRWQTPSKNQVPGSFGEMLSEEFARLSLAEKTILGTAAGLGHLFQRNLLRNLTLLDDLEFDRILDGCLRSGWFSEVEQVGLVSYRFVDPIRQQIALASSDARRQKRLHLLLGAFWERAQQQISDWERSLFHYEMAGEYEAAQRALQQILADCCDREAWDECRTWIRRTRVWLTHLPPERQPDYVFPTPWNNFGWGGLCDHVGCLHYTAAMMYQCQDPDKALWFLDVAWDHGLEDEPSRLVENGLLRALCLARDDSGHRDRYFRLIEEVLSTARRHDLTQMAALASSLLLKKA